MVLVRLVSGVGRDISGEDKLVTSEEGSVKVDWRKANRGAALDCFRTGCAQSGICISTCRGLFLSAVLDLNTKPGGADDQSVSRGESLLALDRKVVMDPDLAENDSGPTLAY